MSRCPAARAFLVAFVLADLPVFAEAGESVLVIGGWDYGETMFDRAASGVGQHELEPVSGEGACNLSIVPCSADARAFNLQRDARIFRFSPRISMMTTIAGAGSLPAGSAQ